MVAKEEEKQEKDVVLLVVSLTDKASLHYDMISIGIIPYKMNQYRSFTWFKLTPPKGHYHSKENEAISYKKEPLNTQQWPSPLLILKSYRLQEDILTSHCLLGEG